MGLIDNLIGYSEESIYEEPNYPDLKLDTSSNIIPMNNFKILS